MKQVLIIDAPPLFREFLKEKLTAEKVGVEVAEGRRDAFTKLISILPDLVLIDISGPVEELLEFLEKKRKDPNANHIPMIISGPVIERERAALLAQYGIVKYFTKPIKFDIFFESIGRILKAAFSIDITPCVLEIHHNNNILFIEIAQGLNREKLSLLKYKLPELIDANELTSPKVILMMTNLTLSFVDGANLELLLDSVTADSRILKKNIKVLSFDSFTRELINGHPQYQGIEVATDLSQILNSLVESGPTSNVADLISDKILSATGETKEGSVEMRFYSDSGVITNDDRGTGSILHIAIVDDDAVTRTLLKNAFTTIGAECDQFDSGAEFIVSVNKTNYDLVILDMFMPGLSGFDILKALHERRSEVPVIVYSQATHRDVVIQALSLGAKSYLVKPQKPETIVQKAMEVIHAKL